MKRVSIAIVALALAACGTPSQTDAGHDTGGGDGARTDGSGGGDGSGGDGSGSDGTNPTGDAADDNVTPPGDGGPGMDAITPPGDGGRPGMDVVTPPIDVPTTDGTGCTGTLGITFNHPTSGESIETCVPAMTTPAERYYNFQATVTGGAAIVRFDWRHPSAGLVPPPFSTATPAPANVSVAGNVYTARRLVGGDFTPTSPVIPLASFGARGSAIACGWQLIVTATDRCGRDFTAMQTFCLQYSAPRSCTP